jgi:Flp pilus assembly protein TadG
MGSEMEPLQDRWTAGSMALEYGLAVPLLILLVLVTMDVARLMWTYTTLQRAVEASARCASVNPTLCGSAGQIASKAVSEAWGLAVTSSTFTAQAQNCGWRVTANYGFTLLIPWMAAGIDGQPNAITLTLSACYPV